MPITVSLPSRNVELEFPDSMTEQEIQAAIEQEYPRSGQDVAFEVEQSTQQTLEGQNLVNPFDAMSNDDYVLYRQHLAEKKTSLGDALGIAAETAGKILGEVGTGLAATGEAALAGEFGQAAESMGEGMVAGTVGLADIADKILNPANRIPSKEEFLNGRVPTGEVTYRPDTGTGIVGPVGQIQYRPATEADYATLIEQEKARDRDATNRLFAMEATLQGAPIEEVARAFQYVDPTLLAGGASALARAGAKTLFKTGARGAAQTAARSAGQVAATTAPGPLAQAALSTVERGAEAVGAVASIPRVAVQAVGNAAEAMFPGTGAAAKAAGLTTAALADAGATAAVVGGAATAEKAAEVAAAAARAARGEASRAGLLERVAQDATVSPTARRLAAGLAQVQPALGTAGRVTAQAVKEGAAGAAMGAGLGYLAERNLEGAAAGAGAGAAFGGLFGTLRGTFRAGREALGYSTERTARQATGDINSFIAERPEIEQGAWAATMSRLAEKIGPEKAAAQADALRIAEANGGRVRVATPDEVKQWQNPGWMNVDGLEVVLNPERILSDTAAHEATHVLFASTLNRAFKTDIENAIYGAVDPVSGEIVRPGLFTDPDLARIADQIADSYGKNTTAANEFRGYANRLRNTTDPAALSEARTRIADELTATYSGKLFGRLRAGRFNPDRLPLVYRRVLNSIEDGIVEKLRTTLFEQGMDLGFNAARGAFTDSKGRPVRIPELDAIIKRAMQPKRKAVPEAKAKPDLIPVNPADRAVWLRSYGGAQGIVNPDGTPKSLKQIEAEAAARWQDMTSRLSALPENERIGLDFTRDKNGKAVMTAKGQLSDAAINTILASNALDQSAKATLREVLMSMKNFDKATFDTRYYGVYTRGRGGNKMVAGVKSASQNEILPYSVEMNSKDGVIIRAVDVTKVRDRLATALKKPQFKGLYGNAGDALKDFRAYLTNLTNINAIPSETLLGGGVRGAQKRNLFYDALGFRLRNNETLLNAPAEVVGKSQDTLKSYRVERFAKLVDSGERLAFEEATTYERAMKNFQPDAFAKETLPNGEAMTNPDGYRILKKTGSKLFRVYDDKGELLGTASTEQAAMRKAQSDFAKKASREEPATIRFQFAGESAELPQFMRDSLEAAKAMAKEGKTSEVIRAITGWFPGKYDDKMRWEVPDEKAIIKGTVKADELVFRAWKNATQPRQPDAPTAELQDILRHPDLFNAYPEAARIPIVADVNLSSSGSIGPMAGFEGDVIQVNGGLSGERLKSTILHEIQHWIQEKEGFARGGNVSTSDISQLEAEIISKAISDAQKIQSEPLYQDESLEWILKNDPLLTSAQKQWAINVVKAGPNAIKELQANTPFGRYRRTAGEIEARDVQARQSFTPEQRKAIAPYSSENIAREEAIVLKSAKKTTKEEKQTRFQPVTPEQDAAYLNAVKAGDTAAAQRLVDDVAKAAGYDFGPVWHGTPDGRWLKIEPIFKSQKERMGFGRDLGVHWFATSKRTAATYADDRRAFDYQNAEPSIIPAYLRLQNPLVIDGKGQGWRTAQMRGRTSNAIEEAINAGNDGVIIRNVQDDYQSGAVGRTPPTDTFAVFNSSAIKSADPVTYDDAGNIIPLSQRFNVESPDIRFQPDAASPSILNGSNGTRIIKSPSGKFRVYSVTGTLLGIRDTEQAAQKLATK